MSQIGSLEETRACVTLDCCLRLENKEKERGWGSLVQKPLFETKYGAGVSAPFAHTMMQVIEITKMLDHIIIISVSISLPRPYARIVGLTLAIFLITRFFLKKKKNQITQICAVLDTYDVKD